MTFMPSGVVAAAGGIQLLSDLVAGTDGSFVGFNNGSFGSMSNRFLGGQTIEAISHNLTTFPISMLLLGENIPNDDSTFVRLLITGSFTGGFNPRTNFFTRVSASYNGLFFGNSLWQFLPGQVDDTFVVGNTYEVEWEL